MKQKNIQSDLQEERQFAPPAEFARRSNLKAKDLAALHAKADSDYIGFWSDLAREHLVWRQLHDVAPHLPFVRMTNVARFDRVGADIHPEE